MGDSRPPLSAFDLVDSYARRSGSDAEIVLAGAEIELPEPSVQVTLRRGGREVTGHGELVPDGSSRRLVVRVPRERLTDGTWQLAVPSSDERNGRIDARLLVQGPRPLVLLWGAEDKPSLEPAPRRASGAAQGSSGRQAKAAAAGRVLDRVLSVLPEQSATRVRQRARTAARRVLR